MLINPGPIQGFAVDQDGSDIPAYRRVKLSSGYLALAGASDVEDGTTAVLVKATSGLGRVAMGDVVLRNVGGIVKMIASEAIPLTGGKANVYAAASGKVAASGSVLVGVTYTAATADGDEISVQRIRESSDFSAAGGTTAAAFLIDSDATTPKLELSGQSAGTGNYKTTIKPPSTLTGNRTLTAPVDANANLVVDACFSATPDDAEGAGNSIPAGYSAVDVGAVTNDANDFIVLPAIADVPIGFAINIAANAGGNFELRTPASSNTKINDVDADGTQEYLCTDTDLIIVTKRTTTGWVAQSLTKLGAVRTAVVPD